MLSTVQFEQVECLERKESDSFVEYTLAFWIDEKLYYVQFLKSKDLYDTWGHDFFSLDEEDGYISVTFPEEWQSDIFQFIDSYIEEHETVH